MYLDLCKTRILAAFMIHSKRIYDKELVSIESPQPENPRKKIIFKDGVRGISHQEKPETLWEQDFSDYRDTIDAYRENEDQAPNKDWDVLFDDIATTIRNKCPETTTTDGKKLNPDQVIAIVESYVNKDGRIGVLDVNRLPSEGKFRSVIRGITSALTQFDPQIFKDRQKAKEKK